jgi:tRNA modification GTPase
MRASGVSTERDTIFALSSGRPPAAIAVIRISGPRAGVALEALTGRMPPPRHATLARVRDPASAEVIDEGLVLWFPGPHSETGEDIGELQIHGGRAVIAATLRALGMLPGLRPAEAGEFTRRAFENGRLDLPAVEGLADLVAAETEAQRRQAFRHLKGFLGERAETWRERLIKALALVEAAIDFADEEEDIPQAALAQACEIVSPLADEIRAACAGAGERLREGLRVAIAGAPNAGKSTLFNRLARREAAIVSPFPGTTRDVLELHLDLGGFPVTVLDTAGIRDSEDPVEREGVRRANEQAAAADLVLWIIDVTTAGWRASGAAAPIALAPGTACWRVINKIDLLPAAETAHVRAIASEHLHVLSSATGEGADGLVAALARFCESFFSPEPALVTRERQRLILQEVTRSLGSALAVEDAREELAAEHLRLAARGLGRLLGRVDVENVLDVIFRDFCIGK